MIDYSALSPEQAEQAIFDWLTRYDRTMRTAHGLLGIKGRDCKRLLLWRERIDPATGQPCKSFNRWVRVACPTQYASLYKATEDVEALPDVADADLAEMRPCNFQAMKQVSTAVRRDPAVLAAAKTEEHNGFVAVVNAVSPDQHMEGKHTVRLAPTDTQMADFIQASELAAKEGATSLTAQHHAWAVEYIQNRLLEAILRETTAYEGTDTIQ